MKKFSYSHLYLQKAPERKKNKKSKGVVRGGQKGLKPPFKYQRNTVFSLLLSECSNEKT